jgi:Tol biopolymer transport system component
MKRVSSLIVGLAIALVGWTGPIGSVNAKASGTNGRIAFVKFDHSLGEPVVFTIDPDGRHQQMLFAGAEFPHWSPDGLQVSVNTGCTDGTETCAATIVDAETGAFRQFKWPDPTLETPCGKWTPDGRRLACEGYGVTDPSRNGIYTIRASDGRGLRRITSNPGGTDSPGDFSPDGKRLVFFRANEDGPVGIFVINVDGSGLRRLTPPGFIVDDEAFAGSWSPSGNRILLTTRTDADHRLAIWVVKADGTGLHQLPISPACGGAFSDPTSISCFEPAWSPDGTMIVFTRISANGTQENVYTVNAEGSGLTQVTKSGGSSQSDWGPGT